MADAAPVARGSEFRIGGVIGSGFSVFSSHFLHFLVMGIILFAVPIVLMILFGGASFFSLSGGSPLEDDPSAFANAFGILLIIPMLIGFIAYLLFIASATFSTVDALRGQQPSIAGSLSRSFGHIVPLVLLSLLFIVVFGLGAAIYSAIVAALAAVGGGVLAVIGGIGGFALAIWVYVIFSVAIPALVIERAGVIGCLSRSLQLTKGQRWKILGIFILLFIVFFLASMLLTAILSGLVFAVGTGIFAAISFIVQALVQLVTFILSAIFISVVYYHLRRAKEGIGLEDIAAVFD